MLTTEEWEEEGEDGKLLPVEVIVTPDEDEEKRRQRHKTRAGRWALYGLVVLGLLGSVGWGVSFLFGAEVTGN